jgi:hypothetical protein
MTTVNTTNPASFHGSLCNFARWFRFHSRSESASQLNFDKATESTPPEGTADDDGLHPVARAGSAVTFSDCLAWTHELLKVASGGQDDGRLPAGTRFKAWARIRDDWKPLAILTERFGLRDAEAHTLAIALAIQHNAMLSADRYSHGTRTTLTPELAIWLYENTIEGRTDDIVRRSVSPISAIGTSHLFEVDEEAHLPWMCTEVRADRRIYRYVLEYEHFDGDAQIEVSAELKPFIEPLPAIGRNPQHRVHQTTEQLATRLASRLQNANTQNAGSVHLSGRNHLFQMQVAIALLRKLEAPVDRTFVLRSGRVLESVADIDRLVQLWQRDTRLFPEMALIVDLHASDPSDTRVRYLLGQLGAIAAPHRTIVLAPQPFPANPESLVSMNVDRYLPANGWTAQASDLDRDLEGLAERVTPAKTTLEDVKLPPAEKELLRAYSDQVRNVRLVYDRWGLKRTLNRGRSISALFAGESGTGKTMAAEAIAGELKRPLYRIDLSAIIDKYVGETEKKLRRVFDAAQGKRVILFFDEADALFGSRSDVKDSHDRYANIQINYLLQRFETFDGCVILATNRRKQIDSAFWRRLRFVVLFPFPEIEMREAIWRQLLPAANSTTPSNGRQLPTAIVESDYSTLRQLKIAGGTIRSIVINAAFVAAARGGDQIEMHDVFRSAHWEYSKLGRSFDWPANDRLKLLEQAG